MRNILDNLPIDRLADFCHRQKITELALFGSILRDDFAQDSDIDMLVTFSPESCHSLFDLALMQQELKALLGRDVDIVEKAALRNPFRRAHILNTMKVIYAT